MTSQSQQGQAAARGAVGALGRWLPLLAAAGVAILLVGSALYSRATMLGAAAKVTHGQGEALAMAVRHEWHRNQGKDHKAVLEAILARHRDSGLRHLAVTGPGAEGPVEGSAGQALGTDRTMGKPIDLGQRVRLVNPLHRQPRRSGRGHKLKRRLFKGPPPHLAKGPPPHAAKGPPPPHPPRTLILEFEPLPARELALQANTQLAVAVGAALAVLLLAGLMTRLLGRHEALRLRMERERRLAALGEMSAVLAHELRNPLASLKGHAQLLEELLEEGTRTRDKAGRVVGEAVRLEELINDLLTYVRSGKLRPEPVLPGALLRQVCDELGDDRLEITGSDGADDAPWPMDRDRMGQALANVLQNGLQASPDGGHVRASVGVVGGELRFVVEDGGSGIPDDELERIFEPFQTGRVRGTGLGLAITRRIVEQHGGLVMAENLPAPASGARLTITLPRGAGGIQE